MPDYYDPADHTVGEVLEYTDGVDVGEVQRVYDAEEAGKARSTLLEALIKQLEVKGWSTPEDAEAEVEPAADEPEVEAEEAAAEESESEPEPVRAAGYVLTDDKGWVLEEE